MYKWTKPYYGIQHLGDFGVDKFWVTVIDHGSFCILYKWFPGCRFSPIEQQFDTLNDAKLAGEKYLKI